MLQIPSVGEEYSEYCVIGDSDCPCGKEYWSTEDIHSFRCQLFDQDLVLERTPDGILEPKRCAECLYRRPQISYSRSHSDFVSQNEKL